MEAEGVVRVLALVAVWAIPAMLVLAVAVFGILSPLFFIWGAVGGGPLAAIGDKLRKRVAARQRRAATTGGGMTLPKAT